jgi:hypothetical protein
VGADGGADVDTPHAVAADAQPVAAAREHLSLDPVAADRAALGHEDHPRDLG